MRKQRNRLTIRLSGTLTVLMASVLGSGLSLALPSGVLGPATAGADTPVFNITCTGIPSVGTATFPTTIRGSVPAEIANESSFTVVGHEWLVTIPASVTDVIDSTYGVGASVTSTVTTTIDATGTMEGSESETVTFGATATPGPGHSFQLTGTPASAPTFTGTGADVSVTPGVTISAFDIFVNSNPITPFPCTTPTPPPVIASATGVHDPIAYATGPGPNTITPIDTVTDTTDPSFQFNEAEPGDIAITPNGATAYVSGIPGGVWPIDLATDTEGSSIAAGTSLAITPDGTTVYTTDPTDASVTPIDTATNTAETPISVGNGPDAIAVTPDGTTAYVANGTDGTVTPINTASDTAGTPINVGTDPDAIAITPNGTTAYVANNGDDTVTPISTVSNTAGTPIDVGSEPDAVAITPNGATAYVANYGDSTVTPISTASNTAGSPIDVGSEPHAVSVTPNGATVEVASVTDNNVTPIDTATNTAGTPIGAGLDPWDIAITPDQAPIAALSVIPSAAGGPTSFDASGSVAPSSPIVNYAWNFGDGSGTTDTSTPTTTHIYAAPGPYTATVTETDAAGTSTSQVFTGQTMSNNGDSGAVTSATFTVLSGVGSFYACDVSGFGAADVPVVVNESPAPPSSIDAGGTFSTDPTAQLAVPASVIDHFIGVGATSLTIASQTTTLDGRSSVGGPLSGAVSPDTESASATDVPQSDSSLVPGLPYIYQTTYNPVTWQTGPGPGAVSFVPGDIDAEATFVIHGTPTSESITCTPPSGVAALGSTAVLPPPANPTLQVASATPPLQNQVSPGTDGGWGVTIANTSKATVTGVSASVSVTGLVHPLTYDLTAMSASGTSCTGAGAGKVTCSVGSLAAGASDTLNLLVLTNGLLQGTTITGAAMVRSTNAGSQSTTLGGLGVVVVEAGNGTKVVAVPGIAVASTKAKLSTSHASVTLTLPKAKIKVTKKVVTRAEALALAVSRATGTTLVIPPPVAVTLESLAPSAEPALCPPTGNLRCEGDIVQVVGNFSAYTNKADPIVAVVKFFYGTKVPAGTVYFLKPNGKTVDKLSTCKKTAGGYDTPCVSGKEVTGGSKANDTLYAQDTVYFTGKDPAMGRR
ncbi:MAG: PKD domain-containing protein [Acidimicrobiales bacterium]